MTSPVPSSRQIIRPRGLRQLLNISRTTLWHRVQRGDLPPPFKLGNGRAVGWYLVEIEAWLDEKKHAARKGEEPV